MHGQQNIKKYHMLFENSLCNSSNFLTGATFYVCVRCIGAKCYVLVRCIRATCYVSVRCIGAMCYGSVRCIGARITGIFAASETCVT